MPQKPPSTSAQSIRSLGKRTTLLLVIAAMVFVIVQSRLELRRQSSTLQIQTLEIKTLQQNLDREIALSAATLEQLRTTLRGATFSHHGRLTNASSTGPAYAFWSESLASGFLYFPENTSTWTAGQIRISARPDQSSADSGFQIHPTAAPGIVGFNLRHAPATINHLEVQITRGSGSSPITVLQGTLTK